MKANSNFELLSESYLFSEVARRVSDYKSKNPGKEIIRMDIGDVTLPIIRPVAEAMKRAVEDMEAAESFHGYGPEQGYSFLREAIAENDYASRGVNISADDIFISDGAKCDIGNLTDIFSEDSVVGIPNPVYPVYVDSNIMAGRTTENGKIVFIDRDSDNNFKPHIPDRTVDVVYLCSPNNPTGGVLDKKDLTGWVEYARKNKSIIIFDSAYEAFIRDTDLPRSIYEIEGAQEVAIEVRSFSKTAGFTGLRCGYTVVPSTLMARFADGSEVNMRKLWLRRQTTKFNGASYVIQRGAGAIYTPEGQALVRKNIDYYLRNAALLSDAFRNMGYKTTGGSNSPYVWIKDKEGKDSWQLFDLLLSRCNISTTPGVGFGKAGEGCIRLTGFNSYENTLKAIERLKDFSI